MTRTLKRIMTTATLITALTVLTACGSDSPDQVAEPSQSTAAATADTPQTKETPSPASDIDLPEDLREDLAEIIRTMPEDMQERILSEFPEELTDEYQDMLASKLERFKDMDPADMDPDNRPEGADGKAKGGFKVGKFGGHHHDETPSEAYVNGTRISLDDSKIYADGTYTGTAKGYEEGLSVEITIQDGALVDVTITDHNETPGFYESAFNQVPEAIVSSQSTDVDTVSGATRSSEGIIVAVEEALAKAEVK